MRHVLACALVLGTAPQSASAADAPSNPLSKAIAAITGQTTTATPKTAAPAAQPAAPAPALAPPPSPVAQPGAAPAAPAAPVAKIAAPAPVAAPPEPAAEPPPEAPRPPTSGQKLEDKLQAAHDRLQLTTAQEAAWAEVSKVLQENQKAALAVFKEKPGNAIDAVRQSIKAAETRIANLKRLGSVLEKFHGGLTEAQQRMLDEAVLPQRP